MPWFIACTTALCSTAVEVKMLLSPGRRPQSGKDPGAHGGKEAHIDKEDGEAGAAR